MVFGFEKQDEISRNQKPKIYLVAGMYQISSNIKSHQNSSIYQIFTIRDSSDTKTNLGSQVADAPPGKATKPGPLKHIAKCAASATAAANSVGKTTEQRINGFVQTLFFLVYLHHKLATVKMMRSKGMNIGNPIFGQTQNRQKTCTSPCKCLRIC